MNKMFIKIMKEFGMGKNKTTTTRCKRFLGPGHSGTHLWPQHLGGQWRENQKSSKPAWAAGTHLPRSPGGLCGGLRGLLNVLGHKSEVCRQCITWQGTLFCRNTNKFYLVRHKWLMTCKYWSIYKFFSESLVSIYTSVAWIFELLITSYWFPKSLSS